MGRNKRGLFETTPLTQLSVADEEVTLILEEAQKAKEWLLNKDWCDTVHEIRFGNGVARIVISFLFRIEAAKTKQESLLWMVYGDIPPYYLEVDKYDIKNGEDAIFKYCELMLEWVEAVRSNTPTTTQIQINVPPTLDWAGQLEKRIHGISKIFLGEY